MTKHTSNSNPSTRFIVLIIRGLTLYTPGLADRCVCRYLYKNVMLCVQNTLLKANVCVRRCGGGGRVALAERRGGVLNAAGRRWAE